MSSSPNVLFVVSWFPSKLHHSLGNFIERHAHAVKRNHELRIFHPVYHKSIFKPKFETEERDGLIIDHLYLPSAIRVSSSLQNLWLDKYLKRLDFKPDVIHAHIAWPAGIWAIRLSEKFNAPLLYTEQWSVFLKEEKPSKRVLKMARQLGAKANAILPVSDQLGKGMKNLGIMDSYQPVPNTVDTTLFHYPGNSPLNAVEKRILHVSTFDDSVKNISGMLNAFSKALPELDPQMKLHLAGDGDRKELQKLIDASDVPKERIRVSGPHPIEEIAELMQSSLFFLLPSHIETFGAVIAECLCCGTPVVATEVGGIPSLVDENNGVLVPPKDDEALAKALVEMNKKIETYDREKIAADAQSLYSYEAVADQLSAIYTQTSQS